MYIELDLDGVMRKWMEELEAENTGNDEQQDRDEEV